MGAALPRSVGSRLRTTNHRGQAIIERLKLDKHICEFLPRGKNTSAQNSYAKFYQILMGFLAGAECLDDLEYLKTDKLIRAVHDKMFAANTEGEFLRSFSEAQAKELNHRLIEFRPRAAGPFLS